MDLFIRNFVSNVMLLSANVLCLAMKNQVVCQSNQALVVLFYISRIEKYFDNKILFCQSFSNVFLYCLDLDIFLFDVNLVVLIVDFEQVQFN